MVTVLGRVLPDKSATWVSDRLGTGAEAVFPPARLERKLESLGGWVVDQLGTRAGMVIAPVHRGRDLTKGMASWVFDQQGT